MAQASMVSVLLLNGRRCAVDDLAKTRSSKTEGITIPRVHLAVGVSYCLNGQSHTKDVLAQCYGSPTSWKKQKEGKKKMHSGFLC